MDPVYYSILHVASVILLTAFTFQCFAAPDPARRRAMLVLTGILSAVVLVAGFGLQAKLALGFPLYLKVKIGCWLVLTALAGVAFRRPALRGPLTVAALAAVLVAVAMVYLKPL